MRASLHCSHYTQDDDETRYGQVVTPVGAPQITSPSTGGVTQARVKFVISKPIDVAQARVAYDFGRGKLDVRGSFSQAKWDERGPGIAFLTAATAQLGYRYGLDGVPSISFLNPDYLANPGNYPLTTSNSVNFNVRERVKDVQADYTLDLNDSWAITLGGKFKEPENSIAAFKRCIEVGVDVIETDVQHTSDGVLVLMHDQTLERTTNGVGRVDEHTLAEIKKLRLKLGKGGDGAPLTGETVPTFEEALKVTNGKILVDLDAKGVDLKRVWADSLPLLERLGMLDQITLKMTAGRDDALMEQVPLLKRVNYLQRVTSSGPPLAEIVKTHAQYKPAAYTVIFTNLPYLEAGAPSIRASGARAWAEPFWGATCGGYSDKLALYDPDANWGRLLQAGATMFLTDRPEELIVYLYGKGLRGIGR